MSSRAGEPPRRGIFAAEVAENVPLCREHYRLRLRAAGFPASRPGQFVQLQCRGPGEQPGLRVVDWPPDRPPRLAQAELAGREPLLRRPFSLAGRRNARDGGVELDVIYRTVGIGTHWLPGAAAGDRLSVLGPLGNAFTIRDGPAAAVLVGGGVGIPPMLYLAEALHRAGKGVVAFNGARTADLLPLTVVAGCPPDPYGAPARCIEEFALFGARAVVATDDGSLGFGGLVSDAFGRWLRAERCGGGDVAVYSCGPEAMMRAVAALCAARHIDCQVALERHMACGMGTCQSCVVKRRDDSPEGWSFALCCTDGPIFDARDVVWD